MWVMSSQVGYDLGDPMRVLVRGEQADEIPAEARFIVVDSEDNPVLDGRMTSAGEKWGSHWWVGDFSRIANAGTYRLRIAAGTQPLATSDPIEVGTRLLWKRVFPVIGHDYLKTRAEQARTGKGWKDCGSDLQEFSSHAVAVDSICDVLEINGRDLTEDDQKFLLDQLIQGGDYMAHLQDKAEKLGFGRGSVIHEDRDTDIVTGNIAQAAAMFARLSRLLASHTPAKSEEYLERALLAFEWLEANGPVMPPGAQTFFPFVHGASADSIPPDGQWMTRDLVTMTRASVELFRAGREEYKDKAIHYADWVIRRQVPRDQAEGGLFGHFYTYDDYSSLGGVRFTEKASIHCGAWSKDGRVYNKGGHYPNYLLPLIDMLRLWPDHPLANQWRACLHDYAYGYLVPACRNSPFLILPAGYYTGEGLQFFGSWYHGQNNIYAFNASLALELGELFDDPQFREIAVGNLQWIAGLNCGKREGQPAKYLPVSMISGIGARTRGSWSEIPGSICNGFSASRQFKIAPALAMTDKPTYFDDEDYIAHSLPYLAALARLEAYRKPQP